jgi:putative MATE family efflux protein
MKDLTQGPIPKHLVAMSIPIAAGMFLQTLYYFVDLYFVAQLGDAALAGVSAAGNAFFLVMALSQMLGVGAVALISHAVGRKDREDANHIFNQSVSLALLFGMITLVGGYLLAPAYLGMVGADAATREAGVTYLHWFIPGLALQFAIVAQASALRGTGIVQPTMVVQALTVVLNAIFAPILIAGWFTGKPLGVAGAGLATSLAVTIGVVVLSAYFVRLEKYVRFDPAQWRPKLATWRRILDIGLPSGGEFALMSLYMGVIYWIIRDFGAAAQAGFGIGSRVNQMIFLPAFAIAFAAAPIAGQNYGARLPDRVRETFRSAAVAGSVVMILASLLVQWQGEWAVRIFSKEPAVIAVGAEFLHVISWNFFAFGLIFVCGSMFQALGNTWPSLISTSLRIVIFMIPALWMSRQPGFQLLQLWYLSVATVIVQMIANLLLLRWQFRERLGAAAEGKVAAGAA